MSFLTTAWLVARKDLLVEFRSREIVYTTLLFAASVLLVGRTHATGLEAVTHTLDIFRRGDAPPGLDLDAVVLVADAPGRLPRPLAQHVKAIEAAIDVYRVPWMPSWRLNDLTPPLPRESAPLSRLTGRAP